MSKIQPGVIHSDQTGYVKQRFIGQNIRLISDVIERRHSSHEDSGIAMFLDSEWPFLCKVLETFGFGHMLVKWIKTFYSNPQSCVTNNGFATPFFLWNVELDRGAPFLDPFCNRCGAPSKLY